jgi:hypothetical protein
MAVTAFTHAELVQREASRKVAAREAYAKWYNQPGNKEKKRLASRVAWRAKNPVVRRTRMVADERPRVDLRQ